MSISGFPQSNNSNGNAANVGDLTQLPTINKTDIVSAIVELEQTKAEQEDLGDVDNINLVQIYQNT